jgi:hypothetical protein
VSVLDQYVDSVIARILNGDNEVALAALEEAFAIIDGIPDEGDE